MTDTYLNLAYKAGAAQAVQDFTKESSNFLNLVAKYPGLGRAAELTAANPLASRAIGGGLVGGIAGGEDNRMLGALAGAGLGAGSRFWAGRAGQGAANRLVPQNMSSDQLGKYLGHVTPGTNLAQQLGGAAVVGGAGLAGGLGMNALGLTDRPQGWFERTFG